MYFIWGEDQYIIDFNEKKITNKIGITPIIFNDQSSLDKIINEIDTISIFNEKKLIILRDLNVLINKDFGPAEDFFNSLKNADDHIIIIFTLHSSKLIKTNSLIQYLLKNYKIIEAVKPNEKDLTSIIKKIVYTKNGAITNKAALQLAFHLPNNLIIINNELNKLLLENNHITEDMIMHSVTQYNKITSFALSNAIVGGNSEDIIEAYYNELNNNVDPIMIIGQLANNYKLTYIIQLYKKKGCSLSEIAMKTSIHIFRITKLNQILDNQLIYSIKELIQKLAQLDNDIKKNFIKKEQVLDKFILDIARNSIIT